MTHREIRASLAEHRQMLAVLRTGVDSGACLWKASEDTFSSMHIRMPEPKALPKAGASNPRVRTNRTSRGTELCMIGCCELHAVCKALCA